MSVKVTTHIWRSELDGSALLIALALADHANDVGEGIEAGRKYLAWKTGLSERTVTSFLAEFRSKGWLEIKEQPAPGRATCYKLVVERIPKKARYATRVSREDPTGANFAHDASRGHEHAHNSMIEQTNNVHGKEADSTGANSALDAAKEANTAHDASKGANTAHDDSQNPMIEQSNMNNTDGKKTDSKGEKSAHVESTRANSAHERAQIGSNPFPPILNHTNTKNTYGEQITAKGEKSAHDASKGANSAHDAKRQKSAHVDAMSGSPPDPKIQDWLNTPDERLTPAERKARDHCREQMEKQAGGS